MLQSTFTQVNQETLRALRSIENSKSCKSNREQQRIPSTSPQKPLTQILGRVFFHDCLGFNLKHPNRAHHQFKRIIIAQSGNSRGQTLFGSHGKFDGRIGLVGQGRSSCADRVQPAGRKGSVSCDRACAYAWRRCISGCAVTIELVDHYVTCNTIF